MPRKSGELRWRTAHRPASALPMQTAWRAGVSTKSSSPAAKKKLHELADRLFDETNARPEVFPPDLGDPEDLFAVERRLATDERITMLVNNAGVAGIDKIAGVDPRRLEVMIDINVMAVARLAAGAAGQMMRRGHGTIVNISSVTALLAENFEPVYSASKAFVLALSQSMARELEPHGIRIQAVLPGITRTAIWEKSGHSLDQLPPDMVMEVSDMVDAALEGLDLGETVTIPSMPNAAEWPAVEEMRRSLSRSCPSVHPRRDTRRRGAKQREVPTQTNSVRRALTIVPSEGVPSAHRSRARYRAD